MNSWPLSTHALMRVIVAVGVVVAALLLAHTVAESVSVQRFIAQFGYSGLFVIALVNSFNAVAPVPTVALVPGLLEAGFSMTAMLLVITLGMTVGDAVSFFIGTVVRAATTSATPVLEKVRAWVDGARARHRLGPYILLFFFASFAPLPNELIVIPLSFMGYRLRYIIPIVFLGNAVFNALTAFGVLGAIQLL